MSEFWLGKGADGGSGFAVLKGLRVFLVLVLVGLGGFAIYAWWSGMRAKPIPRAVVVREDGLLELSLMTFNLRYENAPGDVGQRAWRERVLGIVRMIREEDVDVLGIQEGLHGQVADLIGSLPDYIFYGMGRDDGKRKGEYVGIFFRRDRFELTGEGTFWLSDRPEEVGSMTWGNRIPRTTSWVRLGDRMTGKSALVFNTHLDHQSQPSRVQGVRLVAERMVELAREGEALVFMGDFNAVEHNPAIRLVKGLEGSVDGFEGMVETFDVLNAGVRERGTLHFWMSDPDRQWKVDHIFVSKGGRVLESRIVKSGPPYLSDHFPVTARVVWD